MKPERITEILRQHSQDYKIKDGRIYGIAYWTNLITGEEGTEETDLTDYNKKQLYHWLGY